MSEWIGLEWPLLSKDSCLSSLGHFPATSSWTHWPCDPPTTPIPFGIISSAFRKSCTMRSITCPSLRIQASDILAQQSRSFARALRTPTMVLGDVVGPGLRPHPSKETTAMPSYELTVPAGSSSQGATTAGPAQSLCSTTKTSAWSR